MLWPQKADGASSEAASKLAEANAQLASLSGQYEAELNSQMAANVKKVNEQTAEIVEAKDKHILGLHELIKQQNKTAQETQLKQHVWRRTLSCKRS